MKPQRELGVGKKGMNKDTHVTSLDQNSYIHALNANFQGQDGDSINLQNEESNILCSRFVDGFHVIGIQHDTTGERTYFFLTNPETRESEIGYIEDLEKQISFTDTLKECGCDIKSVLSNGLESIAQVATCTYVTLISDHGSKPCQGSSEGAGCLGFNVNYPVSSIIKQEKCGDVLYFTDDLNPRRRVEVAKPEQYTTKTVFCSDDPSSPDYDPNCDCGLVDRTVCLNCDKMNILPSSEKLCIEVEGTVIGGKTRHGQYVFFAGYCDARGNLINSYTASSGPASIKDNNREVYQQFELDTLTNLSLKLKVSNLDPKFDYYKVAVYQTNGVNGEANAFVVDILPTSTTELLYSGSQELENIDIRELSREMPYYKTAKTVAQANNTLFFSDLEGQEPPNLQPMVNFMGHFAEWRTSRSEEGLYSTSRGTANFKGYMRDEVVPFGIRFVTNQGYKTPIYPLIPRAATNDDLYFDSDHQADPAALINQIASTTRKQDLPYTVQQKPWINDVYSIFRNGNKGCADEERIYKWQFYNTATNEGPLGGNCSDANYTTIYRLVERLCTTEAVVDLSTVDDTEVTIEIDQDEYIYSDFFSFINDRQEDVRASRLLPENGPAEDAILDYFLKSSYLTGGDYAGEIECCDPTELFDGDCGTIIKNDEIVDFRGFADGIPEIEEIPVTCDKISRPSKPEMDQFLEFDNNADPKNINDADTIEFDTNDAKLDDYEFWIADRKDKDADDNNNGKFDLVFERARPFFGSTEPDSPDQLATNYASDSIYPYTFHLSPDYPSIVVDEELEVDGDPIIQREPNDIHTQLSQLVFNRLPCGFAKGMSPDSFTARNSANGNNLASPNAFGSSFGLYEHSTSPIRAYTPYGWLRDNPSVPGSIRHSIPEIGNRIKTTNCYNDDQLFEGGFFVTNRVAGYDTATGNITTKFLNDVTVADTVSFVHTNALFFKIPIDTTKSTLVLSVSNLQEGPKAKKKKDCLWYPAYVRVSLFNDVPSLLTAGNFYEHTIQAQDLLTGDIYWNECNNPDSPLSHQFIDQNSFLAKVGLERSRPTIDAGGGSVRKIEIKLKDSSGNLYPPFRNVSDIIVAVDAPLVSVYHTGKSKKSNFPSDGGGSKGLGDDSITTEKHQRNYFYASGTWGTVAIKADYPPIDKLVLKNAQDLDLNIQKTCVYESRCPFKVYDDIVCNPVPHEKGKFAYWESSIKYPNNNFLYDSRTRDDGTSMVITEADIPPDIRTEFQNVFTGGAPAAGQPYVLSDAADFSCKPIRHFKFPDFNTSPAFDQDAIPFRKNNIFPIGFHIDTEVIRAFLDIAVSNNYITQEFRDSITHYEYFRGDTRFDRSIIAKGLLYDMIEAPQQTIGNDRSQFFSNFPYNDLSDNQLIYTDADRRDYIPHPFKTGGQGADSLSNNRFSFHSPDTHFDKPILPFEMYIESHFRGNSRGSFVEVENHPVFTILSPRAHRLAKILAGVEVALDVALNIGTAFIGAGQTFGGFIPAGSVLGSIGLGIVTAAYIVEQFQQATRFRIEWEEIFYNRGKRYNFAYYYSSVGYYNQFQRDDSNSDGLYGLEGNKLRGLKERLYLKSGTYTVDEVFDSQNISINNFNRESSVYLSLGSELQQPETSGVVSDEVNYSFNLTPPPFQRFADQSRFKTSDEFPTHLGNKTSELEKPIASPYVSLKLFLPNQYGDINNIKFIYTGSCGKLSADNECDIVYGGDTFVNRFYLKRKYPFFVSPMIDGNNSLSDLLPFDYREVRNIGYPKYFLSYRMSEEDQTSPFGNVPNMISEYEFDNFSSKNKYIVPPSKFYLYYYGIPGFMVESNRNLDFRYGENEENRGFYPAQADFYRWTQESNVTIREDNYYFYANVYSNENAQYGGYQLPVNYDPEEYKCRFDLYDRTIYSLPDNSEQDFLDNYRIFLANNYNDFGSAYGPLIALHSLASNNILGLFENGAVIFNAYDTIEATTNNYTVGTGGVFQNRPTELSRTELGYGGTQHRAFVSCQAGYFWADAKRGRVYTIAGQNISDISSSGMTNWFRENLPFRIKQQFENAGVDVPNDLIDNAFEGLGISMVWDDRYSRVFITKLDAKVKSGILIHTGTKDDMPCSSTGTIVIDKRYADDKDKLDFWFQPPPDPATGVCPVPRIVHPQENPEVFDLASWTISYSPLTKAWVSFHSFLPNYYVAHNNYFSSGLNFGNTGIWNHLLGSNQTFQVYYGTLYPWIIEVPVKQNFQTKMFEDFSYRLDVRRYSNEYDYHYFPENFDTAVFYNDREATGLLKLITQQQNNQKQLIELPKFTGTGVDVLATKADYTWSINFFFDNLRENHTLPIWNNAVNNVDKSLNATAFNYLPSFKNHIRGQYLIARLSQNDESRLKYIFENFVSDSLNYDAY